MSKDSRPLIWIIIIIVVLALAGLIYSQYGKSDYQDNQSGLQTEGQSQTASVISSTGTTNAELESDMTKVDGQMKALDSDTANQSAY